MKNKPVKKTVAMPGVKAPIKKPTTGGGFPAIKPGAKPVAGKGPVKKPVYGTRPGPAVKPGMLDAAKAFVGKTKKK